ncbi:MAG: phosphatase PAP2 family protein [Rhizobium sp.]|nr:phosphatase PAP2 family protein [Rhizobium sp.]
MVKSRFIAMWREVAGHLCADAIVYGCVGAYSLICLGVLHFTGHWEQSSHTLYFIQWPLLFLWFMPMMAVTFDLVHGIHRFRSRRVRAYRLLFGIKRLARLFSGMALLMALMIFQGSFTSLKNMLPIMAGGFPYDTLHADIDRIIHFGHDPWQLLYPFAAHPIVLSVVEWNYSVLWFVLCFAALFFVATSPWADAVRTRYMLMFMFVWVFCGNVLAGLFLSAGPAFYGQVTGDTSRFADQLVFLSGGQAHSFQLYLWQIYESGVAGFGSGISAFPSVHVALITMNALFLSDRFPKLALPAAAYTMLIVASSVYLGWHYAIDGYVSIVVVVLVHGLLKNWEVRGRQRFTRSLLSAGRN